jgi:hypothetical protein
MWIDTVRLFIIAQIQSHGFLTNGHLWKCYKRDITSKMREKKQYECLDIYILEIYKGEKLQRFKALNDFQ